MADRAKKISELPVATSAVGADLFIIVANTTGIPVTKQITTNAFSQSFANIVIGAANAGSMGMVTIGDHLTIDDANTGLISVKTANTEQHGVVAQGNNVYINANGYLGVVGGNTTSRGVVQIGDNISVDGNSVISIPYGNVITHGVVAQGNNVYINSNGYIGVVGGNTTSRGVVSVGNNLYVTAGAEIGVRVANSSVAGVMKIGDNLAMTGANSDVLSLSNVVSVVAVPSNSTSTGVGGQIAFNNDYIFVCIGVNTWKRAALSTW
jgi:hypothetical protein